MRQWVTLMCVCSVLSLCLSLLLNESGMKKAFNLLVGVIMLYAAVGGARDLKDVGREIGKIFDESSFESGSYEEDSANALVLAYEHGLRRALEQALEQSGVMSVEVSCHAEGQSIIIDSVTVYGSFSPEQKQQIIKTIQGYTHAQTSIVIREGELDE